jgi:beta-phosphoglucomutase-like phosphatase (HAD superfamily)
MRDALLRHLLPVADGVLITWDFDGVLADSEDLHRRSYTIVAERYGFTLTAEGYRELAGHVEERNWSHLLGRGLDAPTGVESLRAQRADVFSALAAALEPSWLAREVIPALHGVASRQVIVSNNENAVIEHLLERWRLDAPVTLVTRVAGEDKRRILEDTVVTGSILFDDNDAYIDLGRRLGAFTVGVRHGANAGSALDAHVVTHLDGASA